MRSDAKHSARATSRNGAHKYALLSWHSVTRPGSKDSGSTYRVSCKLKARIHPNPAVYVLDNDHFLTFMVITNNCQHEGDRTCGNPDALAPR